MSENIEIEFDDPCVTELERCLLLPPTAIMGGKKAFLLNEQEVVRIRGFSFRILAGEHPPPHFHVRCGGEENSFRLDNGEPLHPNNGLRRRFTAIREWYDEHRQKLVDAWNMNRPTNCPVGPIR